MDPFTDAARPEDAMSSMQGFSLVGQELQIVMLATEPPPETSPPVVPVPPLAASEPAPPEPMDLKA
eukprot:6372830-Amphidinium_carterae.2